MSDEGYIKTLFRLTGHSDTPDFKPTKGPVMVVHGAFQNAMAWF